MGEHRDNFLSEYVFYKIMYTIIRYILHYFYHAMCGFLTRALLKTNEFFRLQPYSYDLDGNELEWHIPLTAYITIALSSLRRVSGVSHVADYKYSTINYNVEFTL